MPAGVQRSDHVELMLADLKVDEFRRIRASYVIAADGGSSAPGASWASASAARTFGERWIVIDTKVLKEWPGHDRLRFHCNPARPTVDCPTPLGHHRWEFPVRDEEDEKDLLTEDAIWNVLRAPGNHRRTSRSLASPATATMFGSPTGGGSDGSSWPATPRTRCRRGSVRACAPAFATWPTCAGS